MGEANPSLGGSPTPQALKGKESPGQRPVCPRPRPLASRVPRRSDASCVGRRAIRWHRHPMPVGPRFRVRDDVAALRLASSSRGGPGASASSLRGTAQRWSPSGPLPSGSSGSTALPSCVARFRRMRRASPPRPPSSEEGRGSREGLAPSRCDVGSTGRFGVRLAPISIALNALRALRCVRRCGRAPHGADRPRRLPVGARLRPTYSGSLVGSVWSAGLPGGLSTTRSRAGGSEGSSLWCHGTLGSFRWCFQVAQLRLHVPEAARGFGRDRSGTIP
jgi:hypothetical protein